MGIFDSKIDSWKNLAPVYIAGIGTSAWVDGILHPDKKSQPPIDISYVKPTDYRPATAPTARNYASDRVPYNPVAGDPGFGE